jgi:hypothetical protein
MRVGGPSSGEERPPLDDKFAAAHWLFQPCHPEAAESSALLRTSNEGPVQLAGTGAAAGEYRGPSSRKGRGTQDDNVFGSGRPSGSGVGWFMLRLFAFDLIAACAIALCVVEIHVDAGGGACGYGILRRAKSALLWMTSPRCPAHSLSQPLVILRQRSHGLRRGLPTKDLCNSLTSAPLPTSTEVLHPAKDAGFRMTTYPRLRPLLRGWSWVVHAPPFAFGFDGRLRHRAMLWWKFLLMVVAVHAGMGSFVGRRAPSFG